MKCYIQLYNKLALFCKSTNERVVMQKLIFMYSHTDRRSSLREMIESKFENLNVLLILRLKVFKLIDVLIDGGTVFHTFTLE